MSQTKSAYYRRVIFFLPLLSLLPLLPLLQNDDCLLSKADLVSLGVLVTAALAILVSVIISMSN
ncbi:MAG: hypothetical protein AB4062_15985 [Crocosphaera sp.]